MPRVSCECDVVLIGQGLAGTALAWQLRWRGSRVMVIDREAATTSSRIAAGLITPITGQRLKTTWRLAEFWPVAERFYRQVETLTNCRFFDQRRMVRLFADERESDLFKKRAANEFGDLVHQPAPLIDETCFANPLGGFEMTTAGQLNVTRYLSASRDDFARLGGYLAADIDPQHDLEFDATDVLLPRWGIKTRRVIFCQGIDAAHNPWFREVRFDATKGEILTLRIPDLTEQRIVHRGIWLAPIGDGLFRAGSTYERNQLDTVPTRQGRDEICSRLREFLHLPFEVIDHSAAVRPIIFGRHPVVGLHPVYPQLGYFNGLASKGVLQAPLLASRFAEISPWWPSGRRRCRPVSTNGPGPPATFTQ